MDDTAAAGYAAGLTTATREIESARLEVAGDIPDWLCGSLIRNGPARFEVGRDPYRHWFDGLAMLHRFEIGNGGVSYASRWLECEAARTAKAHGRIVYGEYDTDPCRTLFGRVMSAFRPKISDNCNVNVVRTGGTVMAMTETPWRIAIDPISLRSQGRHRADGAAAGQLTTAHPVYDQRRGLSYNSLLRFGRTSRFQLLQTQEPSGETSVLASVETDQPSYLHSFGMSRDHLVLTLWPLVVNPLSMLFPGKPFIRNYAWVPERGLRLVVVAKDGGAIVRDTTTDACFGFHHVNAFQDGDLLHVDAVVFADADVVDQFRLERLRSGQPSRAAGHLTRFSISLGTGTVTRRQLSAAALELPRINYARVAGERHRWVYGAGSTGDFIDTVVKIDADSGSAMSWHETACYAGEPVFVAAPDARAEDDGVLLSVVLDAGRGTSFLLVLDAKTLRERARACAPAVIPFGFHGNFFAH